MFPAGTTAIIGAGIATPTPTSILPRPRHRFLAAHGTQSVELLVRLRAGDVVPKRGIDRLDGPTVRFADGTRAEIDMIVYTTGGKLTGLGRTFDDVVRRRSRREECSGKFFESAAAAPEQDPGAEPASVR